jgi:hypothetical protein
MLICIHYDNFNNSPQFEYAIRAQQFSYLLNDKTRLHMLHIQILYPLLLYPFYIQ